MIYVCDTIGRVLTARAQLAHMAWIHKNDMHRKNIHLMLTESLEEDSLIDNNTLLFDNTIQSHAPADEVSVTAEIMIFIETEENH